MLQAGIVGLPNVGKSTLFNALTAAEDALAANYPFATIEPNTGIVPVPDIRLAKLAELYETKKIVPATVTFVDIAGLVAGAVAASSGPEVGGITALRLTRMGMLTVGRGAAVATMTSEGLMSGAFI